MKEEVKVNVKMKGFNPPPAPGPRPSSTKGVALVVVLGMLVLVLVLVVAFLSSVSVELQSAKKYSSGADARALADSAVSLVISQIQDATAGFEKDPANNPIPGRPLAWASQPGMIRSYTGSGVLSTAYKLYSSDTLRVSGSFNPVAALDTEVPPNWATLSALYTDLNKPVAVAGAKHYPIINPSAVGSGTSGGVALEGSLPSIEGCFLVASPATATSATQTNPVPMPVQWLYVLRSGALAAANAAGVVTGAGASDPIVGRIAFWTDDETTKVNVNTASDGTFWDRPWTARLGYEQDLVTYLPVQNEFQRYPGHPAMTSLSVIFPEFAASTAAREELYRIIPRVSEGGSTQATVPVTGTSQPLVPDNQRLFASVDEFYFSATGINSGTRETNPKGTGTLNVSDIERTRFFLTANSRAPEVNLFNKPRVTVWPLQANPADVSNPIGSPYRTAKDRLIAFCSTIGTKPYYFQRYNVFTGTSQDPIPSSQSPTMDWYLTPDGNPGPTSRNQELYTYLQHLTSQPIPGFGGSFSAKYPDTRDQILTEMFDLTRSMVNTFNTAETPNYYYSPFNPSGFIKGQGQVVPLELPNGTKGFGRFPTITEAALVIYQSTPTTISGTMPAGGSISSGSGTNTVVHATFASGTMLSKYPLPDAVTSPLRISGTAYTLDYEEPDPRNFEAVIILEPFNPTPGAPPWTANVRYAISGMNSLGMGFNSGTSVNMVSSIDSIYNATATTGLETNLQKPPRNPKVLGITNSDDPDPANYPFSGSFTRTGTTFNFSGGDIQVDIYQGSSRALAIGDLVQSIDLTFPSAANLPLPQPVAKASVSSGTTTVNLSTAKHASYTDYNQRLSRLKFPDDPKGRWGYAEGDGHEPLPLVVGSGTIGDTVRSVEARYDGPARGDYRMIAGRKNVPADYFAVWSGSGPKYSGTAASERLVHSLSIDNSPGNADTSLSQGLYVGSGGVRGKLVSNAPYNDPNRGGTRNSTRPVAPRGLNGATMVNGSPGDWDTGPGTTSDGPYVNLPDQGNSNFSASTDSSGEVYGTFYSKGGFINSAGIIESGASFSPNRQISSAVAFGSLPTGIDPSNPSNLKPWQTLLFGRHPAAGTSHPGFGSKDGVYQSAPPYTLPPDHLFLDLFTMPIVEPYAISEPFSTAGKVNMNYQIAPFTYLTRSTGMRAVLKSTNIMAIPASQAPSYKWADNNPPDFRYTIEPNERTGTLRGFEARFERGDIFRSASEICEISLVPKKRVDGANVIGAPVYTAMDAWWASRGALTGDNVREGPYGHIYPRLTTKSNTFTVHVMAQSISKANGTAADRFVEGRDQISGEFRGSFLIERYLDPNSDSLVNSAGAPATELDPDGMVGPYKFRVVNTKRFAP